jgi:type II secretory pathway component PulF
MAAASRAAQFPVWMGICSRAAYILIILIHLQLIASFIMYFIIPKFEAIFNDFGISLPPITVHVIEISHMIASFGLLSGLIFLAEFLLLIYLPFSIAGWGDFQVPLLDRFFLRRHTSLILRSLSLVVDAGKPIEVGLEVLARSYPASWVRRRLIHAYADANQGQDWCQALSQRRLIRDSDRGVLVAAREAGNLGWAMRELAETSDRRMLVRIQAAVQILFPLVVLLIGLIVFLIAVAYFSPLVLLIERLS